MERGQAAGPRLVVILLVRHGRAGRRGSGADDSLRPLDEKGRRQAAALAAALGRRPLERIISSPFVRCVETIEPLAQDAGLEIELRDELAEGSPVSDVLALIAGHDDEQGDMVLCTHGDVIEEMVGRGRPAEKGSVWVLDPEHDLEPRRYVLPG
jgi:phosphohistidine phosphatase SixA